MTNEEKDCTDQYFECTSECDINDKECEDEFDAYGRRLGGSFRLAVWSLIGGKWLCAFQV